MTKIIQSIFFGNYLLMVTILAWVTAQVLKTIINFAVTGKLSGERLFGSGGMPSSHSAMVCALVVGVAREQGISSPLFAIAFVLAVIVMYDAMGVRLETGKQARLLNLIIQDMMQKDPNIDHNETLKEMIGHTPLQVVSGALLGTLLALVIPVF